MGAFFIWQRRFVYLNRMLSTTKIFVLFVALFITHSAFAQPIPKYAALVGGKGSGAIKKGEFLAQQGLQE
jgi:hypothetical protein